MGCVDTTNNTGKHSKTSVRMVESKKKETLSQSTKKGFEIPRTASARYTGMTEYAVIRKRYTMLDVIGHGKYGVVYKAVSKADKNFVVAIKVLKCGNYLNKDKILEEVKILRTLDHPNIIKYYEEIEDGPYVFLVTEYCSGGDLLDHISNKSEFGEREAAEITEKILKALNHCHSKNIAHRDIKPENILYSSKDAHAEIKLIDFGLAKKSECHSKTYQTIVGTCYYIAPEVIDGNYTFACDIWSVGVILHILLSGRLPFSGNTDEEIFRNIKKGHISFDDPVWDSVTPPGRDLLSKLLDPDENRRPTAAEALKHEWFKLVKTYSRDINVLDPSTISKISKYQGATKFQKACLNIFVKTLKTEEINKLVLAFNLLDKEKNGYILSEDLVKVFHNIHPEADITELANCLSAQDKNVINYSQFIASALDAKKFLTTERLWALFQYFDVENNNYLTAKEITEVLNQSNERDYTIEEIRTMLKDHGIKETERIDFEMFARILSKVDAKEETLQKVIR
jgi:calcium-dependent protein kinase